MAFPDNSTLIDNFNRASLGANWTTLFGNGLKIDGFHQSYATSNGSVTDNSDAAYYNPTSYGPAIHAYAQSVIDDGGPWSSGTWQAIHLVQNIGSGTTDGYSLYVSYEGSNRIRLYRMDNDSLTQLGSEIAYTPADMDLIGLDRDTGTNHLKAWVNTGGGWTELGSRSDSTYTTGTFNIGLESSVDWDVAGQGWNSLNGGTITPTSGGLVGPLIRGGRLLHGSLLRGGVLAP